MIALIFCVALLCFEVARSYPRRGGIRRVKIILPEATGGASRAAGAAFPSTRATGPIERFAGKAGEYYDNGELYDNRDGALPSIKISGPSSGIGDYVGSRSGPSEARLGREEQRRLPRDSSGRARCSSPISRFGSRVDRTEGDTAVAQEPRGRGGRILEEERAH